MLHLSRISKSTAYWILEKHHKSLNLILEIGVTITLSKTRAKNHLYKKEVLVITTTEIALWVTHPRQLPTEAILSHLWYLRIDTTLSSCASRYLEASLAHLGRGLLLREALLQGREKRGRITTTICRNRLSWNLKFKTNLKVKANLLKVGSLPKTQVLNQRELVCSSSK